MASRKVSEDRARQFIERCEYHASLGARLPGDSNGKDRGAVRLAAEDLGINPNSAYSHLRASIRAYREPDWTKYQPPQPTPARAKEAQIDYPELSDPEMPIEELLNRVEGQFHRRNRAQVDRQWMEIGIGEGPILLAFVGDPHVDDNGCNWPLLKRDVALIRDTPRAYGIGLGDWTNNWSGRLAQNIYPYQETTRPQAWRLAEWLINEIPWLLLIKGNHDLWAINHGMGDPLDYIARSAAPMEDWTAKVNLVFENGPKVPMWISHSFKGSSIYNELHGPMRAAKFSGQAAIYAQGHHHEWGFHWTEDAERGNTWLALKARGYKYIDDYAVRHQFDPQQHGATVAVVVDPSTDPPALMPFRDLDRACAYISYLTAR